MRAVADQDHDTLERWAGMADADTAVVQDAHVGGYPVCLLGIESQSVRRSGFPPTDGPDVYTAGTLFPRSSKKTARAINSASGNRPLVVLANLSGFDGSPESMRNLQLEYGAEIGRAQWVQALAARAEPEAAMNPVLLKPGGEMRSHVVVMGRPAGEITSAEREPLIEGQAVSQAVE